MGSFSVDFFFFLEFTLKAKLMRYGKVCTENPNPDLSPSVFIVTALRRKN